MTQNKVMLFKQKRVEAAREFMAKKRERETLTTEKYEVEAQKLEEMETQLLNRL